MKIINAVIIVLVLAADRISKSLASHFLKGAQGGSLPLIDGVFHLTYAENTGASFGMLKGQFWFLYSITAVAALVLIWILFIRPPKSRGMNIAFALTLGGALGNFYDRLFYKYVIDMFDFRLINFAVFNVADSALCVGIAVAALFMILDERKNRENAADNPG